MLGRVILTRLILVRHGETVWNLEAKLQGQDDSALTPLGITQGRAFAERLSRYHFSARYASDLGRTLRTAELVRETTGHDIRCDARLRERHLGIFQGLSRAEAQEKFPEEFARLMSREVDYVAPGGESFSEASSRIMDCLVELAREHAGQQIVLITHGAVLGAVLRNVLGISPDAPRRFKRFNGSWNVFTFERGNWFLETWGDISHLHQMQTLDDI